MNILRVSLFFTAMTFMLWLAGYITFLSSTYAYKNASSSHKTDAIIVLTGGQQRVITGLELFSKGYSSHLFISGVNPGVTKSAITSLWNKSYPLPSCCIYLGTQATDTKENAQEIQKWLQKNKYSSARVVTSHYHMKRALFEIKRINPNLFIIPHAVTSQALSFKALKFWALTFSEYNKSVFRMLCSQLDLKSQNL